MRKVCAVALAAVVVLVIGGLGVVYFAWQNWYNPSYHGKRVHTWANIVIRASDPGARREAAQALVEAFPQMTRGEPRIELPGATSLRP
jgi:hypothetical protein